jgi:hypothetical protein
MLALARVARHLWVAVHEADATRTQADLQLIAGEQRCSADHSLLRMQDVKAVENQRESIAKRRRSAEPRSMLDRRRGARRPIGLDKLGPTRSSRCSARVAWVKSIKPSHETESRDAAIRTSPE